MLVPDDLRTTPPSGWRYVEETGVSFTHHNYTAIMSMIREHRRAVGLPIHGDWIEQVKARMCEQNPSMRCHDAEVKERVWLAEDVMRFATTLKEKIVSGEPMVDDTEQSRRATICAACPKNGYIACRICGPLGELITSLLGGHKPPPEANELHGKACLACGCSLAAKINYPLSVLQNVDAQLGTQPDYDSRCWMRE